MVWVGVDVVLGRFWGTMQQEYPLHCEPLSSLRSHSTSSPRLKSSLLAIPALCPSVRQGTPSKGLGLGAWHGLGCVMKGTGEEEIFVRAESVW